MIEDTARSARLAQLNAMKAADAKDAWLGGKITSGPDPNDLSYKAWLAKKGREARRKQLLDELRDAALYGKIRNMTPSEKFRELMRWCDAKRIADAKAALADPAWASRLESLNRIKYEDARRPKPGPMQLRSRGLHR